MADTDAQAIKEAEPSIAHGYRASIAQLEGAPSARRRAELETVRTLTYDDILRDKVIVGSPATVTRRLKELQDQLGIDGILAELNFGAQIPAPPMMRSLQLLCQEVKPNF